MEEVGETGEVGEVGEVGESGIFTKQSIRTASATDDREALLQ